MSKENKDKYLKELDNNIGQRIRYARSALGFSQSDLAKYAGVSIQQLAKYEKGINRVSVSRLSLIADKLRKKLDYFHLESTKNKAIENQIHSEYFSLLIRKLSKLQNVKQQKALMVILDGLMQRE